MISVTSEKKEGKELEAEVDEDITAFQVWFQSKGQEPLSKPEWAILKTYLWYKTHPEQG